MKEIDTSRNALLFNDKMYGVAQDVFPTKSSVGIFVLYVILFVNQGLLVTASQSGQKYNYDIVIAVLLTEVIKLIISIILYSTENSFYCIWPEVTKHRRVLLLYFVPATLYCIYNTLSYINLLEFDPTTYFLLLQFRVVITGILFQYLFKKVLTKKQWLSLIILMFGCMMKGFNFENEVSKSSVKQIGVSFNYSLFLIIIQILCSCFAGVYNEYLLKTDGNNISTYIQNIFMYLDSIVCNLFLILLKNNAAMIFSRTTYEPFKNIQVILVILNNAAVGIVTSFFLRSLNSIIKNFASAIELVFTAILSYIFFSIPIYSNTVIAILLVIFSSLLYTQNPVINTKLPDSESGIVK